jgi:hypothetical protein
LEVIDESQTPHDQRQRVNLSVPDLATHFGARGQGLATRHYGDMARFAQLPSTLGAYTDSTTGTAAATLAAGVGVSTVSFDVALTNTGAVDVITGWVPGYKFKILAWEFITGVAGVGSSAGRYGTWKSATDVERLPAR